MTRQCEVELPASCDASLQAADRLLETCIPDWLGDKSAFVRICMTEVIVNAKKHGDSSVAVLSMLSKTNQFEVQLFEPNSQVDPSLLAHSQMPDVDAESGRGLPIVVGLTDEATIEAIDEGTRFRMVWKRKC